MCKYVTLLFSPVNSWRCAFYFFAFAGGVLALYDVSSFTGTVSVSLVSYDFPVQFAAMGHFSLLTLVFGCTADYTGIDLVSLCSRVLLMLGQFTWDVSCDATLQPPSHSSPSLFLLAVETLAL